MMRNEILFIDPAVPDIEGLIRHLRPEVAPVRLTAAAAAPQIAAALAGRRGLAAIHLMAHGAPGRIAFSGGDWRAETIDQADLAPIGAALHDDGAINLWACETAAGAAGAALLAHLGAVTGARVAGAKGLVGASALGGAWRLDNPASRAPLTEAGTAAWQAVLVTSNFTGGFPPGVGGTAPSLTFPLSGIWNSFLDWDSLMVPGAFVGDAAVLGGFLSYTVSLNSFATGSLSALVMTGLAGNQILSIGNGGVLNVNAAGGTGITLQNFATVALVGGTINNTGVFSVGPLALVNGFGTINQSGSGTLSGGGTISPSGGNLVLNGAGASFVAALGTSAGTVLSIGNASTITNAVALNNANQSIFVRAGGTLALAQGAVVSAGTLSLTGGTVVNPGTLTVNGTGQINGAGIIGGTISGGGTITSIAGVLDLTGVIAARLAVATHSALRIDGSGAGLFAVAGLTIDQTQALEVVGTGMLDIGGTQTISNGATLAMAGGSFDANLTVLNSKGIIFGNGTITNSNFNISGDGAGTVEASSGTLRVFPKITGGVVLLTDKNVPSTLDLISNVTTPASVVLAASTSVVRVESGATLTITAPENQTAGVMALNGGTLSSPQTYFLASGAQISGNGVVNPNLGGTGTLLASAGVLDVFGAFPGGIALQVDTLPNSDLKLEGTATIVPVALTVANQTLEIGGNASITVSAPQTLNGGAQLRLNGGTLNDNGITNNTTISGNGIIGFSQQRTISGSGTLRASGGTLQVKDAITNGISLVIDPASQLTILNTATAAAPIALTASNQVLSVGAGGTLVVPGTETLNGGATITLAGGTFSSANLVLLNGTVSGAGTLAGVGPVGAVGAISGVGSIQATGGRLSIQANVSSGVKYAIGTVAGSELAFLQSAALSFPLNLSSANQTLSVGSAGNVNIGPQLGISGGATISLAGGQLNDSNGLAFGGLIGSGVIVGSGIVGGPISGSGLVRASGGMLDLTGGVAPSAALQVDTIANSNLRIDGTALLGNFLLSNANQTLEVGPTGIVAANSLTVNSGATLQVDGGSLSAGAGIGVSAGGLLNITGSAAQLGSSQIAIQAGGTVIAVGGTLGTGRIIFANGGGGLFLDSGTTLPTNPFGVMTSGSLIKLTGITARGAGKAVISNHQISFPSTNGAQTLNIDPTLTTIDATYFVTPDDNNNTLITGVPRPIVGAVTLRGGGTSGIAVPFDTAQALAAAQAALNPINAGVLAGNVISNVQTAAGGIIGIQNGKTGQFFLSGTGTFGFAANYNSVIANTGTMVTVIGGTANGQVVVSGQDGLAFNAGTGIGSVFAGGGNNLISVYPGFADQTIYTGVGDDTVVALGGNDFVDAGPGNNQILTGAGNDTINSNGSDLISSGAIGNTTISASNNNPVAFFGPGNTVFNAGVGKATVVSYNNAGLAGVGNATINGHGGTQIWLGSNRDIVNSTGADTIIGASGSTTINATGGNDFLFAGSGSTSFNNSGGVQTILGSSGANATLNIQGGAGSIVALSYGNTQFAGGSGADTIAGFGGSVTITGGSGQGLYLGGPAGSNSITGGSGQAIILGGGAGDVLTGGTGAGDIIQAGAGATTISVAGRSGTEKLYGGAGPNLIKTGTGNANVLLGSGSTTVIAGGGVDLYSLTKGNANVVTLQNFGTGANFLHLIGFPGNEAATALAGAQTLSGGGQASSLKLTLSDGTSVTFAGYTGLVPQNFL